MQLGRRSRAHAPHVPGPEQAWTSEELVARPRSALGIDLPQILGVARRQAWLVAACVAACLVAALLYISRAEPLYSASARLLIEPSRSVDWISETQTITPGVSLDRGVVESQIEVLRSDNAVAEVSERLGLGERPYFQTVEHGPLGRLVAAVKGLLVPAGPDAGTAATDVERTVYGKLVDGLDVDRIDDSYAISVSYVSPDPALSAEVANAFADTYIADLLRTRADMSKVAVDWIDGQLAAAEKRVEDADAAIRDFRAAHDLLADGPVGAKQLVELSTQIATARADLAGAEARLAQFRNFTPEQRTQAALPEALTNPIILGLRNQYLTAAAKLAEVERVFSAEHPDAARLRDEMRQTQRLIDAELDRMGLSYENEVAIGKARVSALEKDFAALRDGLVSTDEAAASLRRLEWNAEAASQTLETLEAQRRTAAELQAHPSAEARIISPAVAPMDKSQPREALVLLLAIFAGCGIGASLATLRELADSGFRIPEQVHGALGVPCLGLVPETGGAEARKPAIREALAAARLSLTGSGGAIASGQARRTLGVICALPGEGCSTVAVHLCSLLSEDGGRVSLLDGRSPAGRQLQVLAPGVARAGATPSAAETLVIDFPPLATSPEAVMRARDADALVLVVAWGSTPQRVVENLLDETPGLRERLAGVVLNRVDFRTLPRYAERGSTTWYLARQKRDELRA